MGTVARTIIGVLIELVTWFALGTIGFIDNNQRQIVLLNRPKLASLDL